MIIIHIIPSTPTYPAVADLRVTAERGDDPELYEIVAKGFDALNMPASAARMRARRDHYHRLREHEKTSHT